MAAPNFQTSGKHNLYLAVQSTNNTQTNYAAPKAVTNYADGTDGSGGSGLTDGIAELIASSLLVRSQNVRDLNIEGSENRQDITTRQDSDQGLAAEVITTTSNSFNYEMIYKKNDPAASDVMKSWVNMPARALILAQRQVLEIYAIDLDGVLDFATPANNMGLRGLAANWTVSLSEAKQVQGVVMQTATFALSTFGELLVHNGTSFIRVGTEVGVP